MVCIFLFIFCFSEWKDDCFKIYFYFREYKEGDRTRVETTYSYSKYGVCLFFKGRVLSQF